MISSSHALHPWLTHQGSLTDKLKAIAHHVYLDVQRHEWGSTTLWDQHKLGLSTTEKVLQREIIMRASSHDCWYARTILPEKTYESEASLFSRLKTQALGELIWHHPHIQRIALEIYPINQTQDEYHFLSPMMHQNKQPLWARLATWSLHTTHRFYLLEIFLPDLENYYL
jgi:chorismate--pyruvate lyase